MNPLLPYGLLGLPLAMAALPVYVLAPAYYSQQLGLPLAITGTVLFAARLIDMLQDPWLGQWVDHLVRRRHLHRWLAASGLLLATGFAGLWAPQVVDGALAWWLGTMLVLACTAHGFINIAYLAWGATLAPASQTAAAAWREGAGLVGVLLASAFAGYGATLTNPDQARWWQLFSLVFALLLAIGLGLLLRAAPSMGQPAGPARGGWRHALALPVFRGLLWPYFINAVAVAIPATLALFFIRDRLMAPAWSGVFLSAYFVAGAAGLPGWTRLCRRIGVARAWQAGMLAGMAGFVWAVLLQPGQVWAYLAVCVLSGLAFGADLALPPVLLARIIPLGDAPGTYYGVWSLLGKLALALSGLALPLLAALGYHGGNRGGPAGGTALALVYAGLPCALKLLAFLTLQRWLARLPMGKMR
ncbi:MFS transporter [Jeongeupia naejangsanensis]|uniref:MFS transporter n=1 Tax=Jeongeupia naejangsanensis TaxID=613195 RepID=A0ABS2BPB8_9NEIS|nr:MFS transporter [Jeongeupia naejangsanensis]MBM3117260.1 MFS transporter [Jeongeupia naejangsanensis]